jgi:hypothetical protein
MIMEKDINAAEAVLHDRRAAIVDALARYIARPDHGTPTKEHRKAAGALFDATLAAFRSASPPASLPADVERRSIARFGDGLLPVLKDAVGPDLSGRALSRVSDAYWQMINSVGVPAV